MGYHLTRGDPLRSSGGKKNCISDKTALALWGIIKRINKNDQCGDPSEADWFLAGPVVVERITIIMCPSTTLPEYSGEAGQG